MCCKELTLSQMRNFRLFQTKTVSETIFEYDENGRKYIRKVENTAGKGEIVRYEQFFFLPVFSKDLNSRYVKTKAYMGKG